MNGIDYSRKGVQLDFSYPITRFVSQEDFEWAVREATIKKRQISRKWSFCDMMRARAVCTSVLMTTEPTIALMDGFARNEGYDVDINGERFPS